MTTDPLTQLDTFIAEILPEVIALRQDLHQHPELASREFRTSARVRDWLVAAGLQPWEPLLETDVIAELPGESAAVRCLRADIDAVPGQEESALPYRSQHSGAMHACGHDGHTAMLAGAARVLARWPEPLPLTTRFIFQPGEELSCLGKPLVERGACRDAVTAYAMHVWHGIPVGCFSSRAGILFAAGCTFTITIDGRGCHGALPELGLNPLPIAARLVTALLEMHTREQAAGGSVVTICMLHGGATANAVPDAAELQGTARYLSDDTGARIRQEIVNMAASIAQQSGATARVEFTSRYDLPVLNTAAGYQQARATVEQYFPRGSWQEARITMGMEDFAYFLPGREGAMVQLGAGETSPPLHSPRFNFPDAALAAGIKFFCLLALAQEGMAS